ncbi:MAG: nucleotide exchange factor GrpE [Candidatus Micrarchaeaceae archaeon]
MEEKEDKKNEKDDAGEEEVKAEPSESDNLKDRILRMAAEFDNYKKRVAKEIDGSKEAGKADIISKLLPTVDEFELALDAFGKDDEHRKGIALIYSNLMGTLRNCGLREIESQGKFDPYRHEIVLTRESKEEDGVIIEVIRKGYMLNNIMLRPASVIVSKIETEKKENGE